MLQLALKSRLPKPVHHVSGRMLVAGGDKDRHRHRFRWALIYHSLQRIMERRIPIREGQCAYTCILRKEKLVRITLQRPDETMRDELNLGALIRNLLGQLVRNSSHHLAFLYVLAASRGHVMQSTGSAEMTRRYSQKGHPRILPGRPWVAFLGPCPPA